MDGALLDGYGGTLAASLMPRLPLLQPRLFGDDEPDLLDRSELLDSAPA